MPELPEVETVVRGLKPHLEGRVLASATVRRDAIRSPIPPDFAKRVAGRRILSVERRAKYVWIRLEGGDVVIVHLGMSGRLVLLPKHIPNAGPHDHVDFTLKDGPTIRFTDPRRFGVIDLCATANLAKTGDSRIWAPNRSTLRSMRRRWRQRWRDRRRR